MPRIFSSSAGCAEKNSSLRTQPITRLAMSTRSRSCTEAYHSSTLPRVRWTSKTTARTPSSDLVSAAGLKAGAQELIGVGIERPKLGVQLWTVGNAIDDIDPVANPPHLQLIVDLRMLAIEHDRHLADNEFAL